MLHVLLLSQMTAMSLSSVLFAAHPPVILAAFLVTAVPFLTICLLDARSMRILQLLGWGCAIFLTLCLGYLFNPLSADPMVKIVVVFLVFSLGWVSAIAIDPASVARSIFFSGAAGLTATAIKLYREGLSTYFEEGERLTGGEDSHPNLVGLTMVCVALCSTTASSLIVRYAFWGVLFLISYVVQSRNAMLALLIIMAIYLWRDLVRHLRIYAIGAIILVSTLCIAITIESIWAAIANLFLLDNPYRGSGSNLVGRAELWQATWNLFTEHPVFGFGLGQHQIGAGIEMYAHNMYLIVLSESGQLGLITFIAATMVAWRGIYQNIQMSGTDSYGLSFALILILVTYYTYGVFEGRAVNAGNFLSYLFFFAWGYGICCFDRVRSPGVPHMRDTQAC